MATWGRTRRALGFARRERDALRALRPQLGIRRAIGARVRTNLELDDVAERLDSLTARLEAHEEALAAQREANADIWHSLEGVTSELRRLQATTALVERIAACEAWVAHAEPSSTLVTVIMPTRDRAQLLRRAIASVEAQTHQTWELIVVDNGSTDETPGVLAALEDPRIRCLTSAARGDAAARNEALAVARGDVIGYLDDDNRMLPGWLAAVAWAFDRHPEHDVLYGARVLETMWDSLPETQLEPFDPLDLQRRNLIDGNVLAHRRGLPEARWAEDLPQASDWDLALRLTADHPPLVLPVRGVLYATSAPNRQSQLPGMESRRAEVQRRWRARQAQSAD